MWSRRLVLALLAGLALAGCGSATVRTTAAPVSARGFARWSAFAHLRRPLDLVGPLHDGALVLAADGRLWTFQRSGAVSRLAPAYASPGGEEPYIALAAAGRPGCSFGPDTVYALRLGGPGRGVVAVSAAGRVRQLAHVSAPGLLDGIAFDDTGSFGHKLLVTVNAGSRTTVLAIDCHGTVRTITGRAPRVEGAIAVAPAGFGRFAGDLIAPDETSGRIFAITPQGQSVLVARSDLPHGQDVGVESEAFVRAGWSAFVADRLTPGNPHPGDDLVLRLSAAALRGQGVRAGDLLAVTEGGALVDDVACGSRGCRVREVATGPRVAHVEGHVAFAPF